MQAQIGTTILEQLGGNRFQVMTGARAAYTFAEGIQFTLPRNASKANRFRVTLDAATDTYSLKFWKLTKTKIVEVAAFDLVHVSELRSIFERVTGLATSLGTMGGQS